MKAFDIQETGEYGRFWIVSFPPARREAIVIALNGHDAVSVVSGGEELGVVHVYVSKRAEDSDMEELRCLIERMAGEEEKPKRHPILDENWVSEGKYIRDCRRGKSILSDTPVRSEVIARVPDLLRALEKTSHNCFDADCTVCAILREMSIVT